MARRDDTIFALSTAPGRAAIAIIRISGGLAVDALSRLSGQPPPEPRRAANRRLRDPRSGDVLDQAVVLHWRAPETPTGEDVVELHCHGGPAVIDGVIGALGEMTGLRLAEPGEFTRRAFAHGRLDLTQIDGLADLLAAETAAQRRQALRQLAGADGALYDEWHARLLRANAHLAAAIDFADEDLPDGLIEAAREEATGLGRDIGVHLDDGGSGERLRAGLVIAITGAPNVGKSSLLNRLVGRDAAIVSAVPGTTRDVIEIRLDLDGFPVTLLDTAGLRDSADPVEAEGMRRARDAAMRADLVLAIEEAGGPVATARDEPDVATIRVWNKIDLMEGWAPPVGIAVSARTGEGMDALKARLTKAAATLMATGHTPVITRARHRQALGEVVAAIARMQEAPTIDVMAEEMRVALTALGRITGRSGVEDILDLIFAEFCLGK